MWGFHQDKAQRACTQHICLHQPDKSAVAEQTINEGHCINFDTTVLAKKVGYMDCTVKEATEVQLNPDNFNKDIGFTLS
jgi:hypothetical protein